MLIESAAMLPYELAAAAIGATLSIMGSGVGDSAPATAEMVVQGRALRPPAPVHLHARRLGDGTIRIGWTRRSRVGWPWLDGGDAPLGEEAERYRLTLTPSTGSARTVESGVAAYDYAPAEQAADGVSGASSIMIEVAQLGSVAASLPPATRVFAV